MKSTITSTIVKRFVSALCLVTIIWTSAEAGQSKLLVNIVEKTRGVSSQDTGGGTQVNIINMNGGGNAGATPQNATQAETLVAKYLIQAKYDVLTSDDLSALPQLTESDLAAAKGGNLPALRKTAALNDAGIVFSATITSQTSREDVVGMEMSKAVTTISYKLVDTSSGNVLDIDNQSYKSASRSPEEATQKALESLAAGISQRIAAKVTAGTTKADQNKLAGYKKSFAKKVVVAKAAPAEEPPAPSAAPSAVAGTSPQREAQATPAADSAAPQIVIVKPSMGRGFQTVEKKQSVTLEGLAIDSSGIKSVKVNGNPASVDAEGRFIYKTELASGDNRLFIVAMNNNGITSTKDLLFNRPEDKDPPEIILTTPSVGRGFTVTAPKPGVKTLIAGLVKDDSDLMYLRINEQAVTVSADGNFSKEIDITSGQDAIIIDAMDKQGNQMRKEFKIAKSDEATRSGQTGFTAVANTTGAKPALWGLIMGVSQYKSTAVDLKYADKDALSLADFLKKQSSNLYAEVHIKTLINQEVTRDSVIQTIASYLGQAAPDDVVFIFLAGHGIKHRQSGSYYFVPYDADYDSILSKGMRMSDFEESINILSQNVGKIVVALDTCHSGAMDVGMRSGGGSSENLAEALKEASGRYILAASKGGEESLEDEKFKLSGDASGHGVFTYALLQGLSGEANYDKDEYISLNELFQYVAKQVPRLTDGRQHPYFRTEGTDLPFLITK